MLQAAYCKDKHVYIWPSDPRMTQPNQVLTLYCNLLILLQKLNQVASDSSVASTLAAQNSQKKIEKMFISTQRHKVWGLISRDDKMGRTGELQNAFSQKTIHFSKY